MRSLLVMVPIRGRRKLAERMLASFTETTTEADLVFIMDDDDKDTYDGMDWSLANVVVMAERLPIGPKFNNVALTFADQYDAMLGCGDDHIFRTPGWDMRMRETLEAHGGTGWVSPDDKRRYDIPEISLVSTDIVRALGWFNSPTQSHYYADNIVADLGRRTELLWHCPQAVIEHMHYSVCPETEHDETYSYAERTWGESDFHAYQEWRNTLMSAQVSLLRRMFNPDVRWVMESI